MTPQTTRRILALGALAISATVLFYLSTSTMGEDLVYYWSPTEITDRGDSAYNATVRLGGMVEPGSVDWEPESQRLAFRVTDGAHSVAVEGKGAPPQMFREGIGVVVEGTVNHAGIFESDRLMVKHSNEYRAPEEGTEMEDLYRTVEDM